MSELPIDISIKHDDNNTIKAVFYAIIAFNLGFDLKLNIQHDTTNPVTMYDAVKRSTEAAEFASISADSAEVVAEFASISAIYARSAAESVDIDARSSLDCTEAALECAEAAAYLAAASAKSSAASAQSSADYAEDVRSVVSAKMENSYRYDAPIPRIKSVEYAKYVESTRRTKYHENIKKAALSLSKTYYLLKSDT